MPFKMILPPFPFPERWADIELLQRTTGEHRWLVPNTANTTVVDEHGNCLLNGAQSGTSDQPHTAEDTVIPRSQDHDDYFETEELELDPAWAERFSKTIKKMKQKVHKAKRRAEWKKK